MKRILNIVLLGSLLMMNTKGICQTINEGTNPTATRARCSYGFDSGTGNTFSPALPDITEHDSVRLVSICNRHLVKFGSAIQI